MWIMRRLMIGLVLASILAPSPALSTTALASAGQWGAGLEFGQVINDAGQIRFTDAIAQRMAQAGASWVRVNFRLGGFYDWTETSTFGVSALSLYEEVVATAQRHNLRVVGLLSNEAWHGLRADWQVNNAEVMGGDGGNDYLYAFTHHAASLLVQHFAADIGTWEVWNEPNAADTYLYPSNFAWLLANVYREVLATVPSVLVISGGLSSVQDSAGHVTAASTGAEYLRATYAQGKARAGWEEIRASSGSYPLDAVGQHLYVDGFRRTTRESMRLALQLVRDASIEGEQGYDGKPTIVTEVGWASTNVSERVQADNLQIAFAEIGATPWVAAASWFFLRDEAAANLTFGLLRSDSSEKPAWQAYRIVTIPAVPPLPPTGVVAAGMPDGVRLDWHENPAPDLAGYHVYRGDAAAGPFTLLATTTAGVPAFVDTTVPSGIMYYYQIAAVDSGGNVSAVSVTVSAMRASQASLAPFDAVWARTDYPVADGRVARTWMWGSAPFTLVLTERYDDATAGSRQVQYYDKSRMELTHPGADASSPWYVTNGLLIVEMMSGWMQVGDRAFLDRAPAQVNVAGDPDSGPTYAAMSRLRWASARPEGATITQRLHADGSVTTESGLAARGVTAVHHVQATKHTVAAPFWEFMNARGLVYDGNAFTEAQLFLNPFYATGYPITEAYWTTVTLRGTVTDVLVQCFERRCLTYAPDNPEGWQVEAGNVGQHYYRWRYGAMPGS